MFCSIFLKGKSFILEKSSQNCFPNALSIWRMDVRFERYDWFGIRNAFPYILLTRKFTLVLFFLIEKPLSRDTKKTLFLLKLGGSIPHCRNSSRIWWKRFFTKRNFSTMKNIFIFFLKPRLLEVQTKTIKIHTCKRLFFESGWYKIEIGCTKIEKPLF